MKFVVFAIVLFVLPQAQAENSEAERIQCLKAYAAYANDWKVQDFSREQIEIVHTNEDGSRTEYVWNGKRIVRTPVEKGFLFGHTDVGRPEAIWDQEKHDQLGNGKLLDVSDREMKIAQEEILRKVFERRQHDHHRMGMFGRSNIYPPILVRATYNFLASCEALKSVEFEGLRGASIGEESGSVRERLEYVHERRWKESGL